MNTDQLIDKLVAEGAQKPLPHPIKQILFWTLGALVYLAAFCLFLGFRDDIAVKLADPLYIPELILMSLASLSAASTAVYLSRPDCGQMPWVKYAPFGFIVLWAVVAFRGLKIRAGCKLRI